MKQLSLSGFPDVLRPVFEPLEFLGEGGFGRVWRVRRLSDGLVAALKVPVISSPELGRVFLREVGVWLGLRHPNIVRLIDANVVPAPYLLMEYVPGAVFGGRLVRSLEDLPKPVEPSLAVRLFEGIAAGVAHAHSRGIVHRDLKPLNILLGEGLVPKISDWGLARIAAVTSRSVGLRAYSPAFAAPEQVDEEVYGGTDERTDIYQLGVILYELLTGHLPYEASTPAAVVAKIASPDKAPKPPSAWDPGLAPFDAPLMRALAKRKSERYARVEDFVRDVREALKRYGGATLEEVRREVEEVRRSMRRSIRAGRAAEVRALKARYAEVLGKYALAALREGEVEEAVQGLEELLYYTRKHEEELATIIREIEIVARERGEAGEELIKRVRLAVAKIVAEVRGGT